MILDRFKLNGGVAIITGGGGGLGRAIAMGLAEAEARIVVADIANENGKQTSELILKIGGDAIFVKVDLTKRTEVENLVETTVKKFGNIDILVNNAGVQLGKPVLESSEEDWHRVMDINLTSAFLCSRFAGEYMVKRGKGKIINVSSTAGITAATNQSAYSASKAGLILLTKSLALEWARYNINVNAIAPGYLRTAFSASALDDEKVASTLLRQIPLRRFGNPSDIVPLVLYLASPASDYMTGETILIDGGHLCHM